MIAFVIYLGAAVIAALLARVFAIGALLAFIVEIIAAFLLQAALVKAVQDVRDGRADLSIGETVSAATPYIWPVFAASFLAGIVLERTGVFGAFGRSYRLVRGQGWHVLVTLVLLFVIMLVTQLVLGLIFAARHAAGPVGRRPMRELSGRAPSGRAGLAGRCRAGRLLSARARAR